MNISKNVDQSMSLKTDDVEDAQLLERYNKLLRKVNTQKLILSVIKETKAEDIADVTEDERAKIDHALNFARAFEYMKLDDKGSNILGISNDPPELTYFEQKAFKTKFLEKLAIKFEPQLKYIRKMAPEVLDSTAIEQQLLDAKQRESELFEQMAEKELKLCDLLIQCAELKSNNPNLLKKVELLKDTAAKYESRAETLKLLLQDITSNDIGSKARTIIETYVNNELAASNADQPNSA